jgi:23S rRNA U2552 (ribose-2'-O)-methylase RlmE/FtsJ
MLEPAIKVKLILNNSNLPSFNITTGKIDEYLYFNKTERDLLIKQKNQIDSFNSSKEWDKNKKISNLYELIHISNNKFKHNSIARYYPLSRSFFKMWEMINHFGLINQMDTIVTGHLAEGPGGFIEACIYYRQRLLQQFNINLNDKYYGITLNPYTREIPGWVKTNNLIKKYSKNIHIDYGVDNTGDLYNVHNSRGFAKKIMSNGGADLITSDGGFDFSVDFSNQEQMSIRLILSELLTGINSQKINGSMICKIFDTYSYIHIQLLYFITCLYSEVYLFKPLTSRPANSEKYLVALKFKGFNNQLERQYYISRLETILESWDNVINQELIFSNIFVNPPKEFFDSIQEYNGLSFLQQQKYIDKTINLIVNYPEHREIENIINQQTEKAIQWCIKYNMTINSKSDLYKKYSRKKQQEFESENQT